MTNYECKRCFYKTKFKNDMRRHINAKQRCIKTNIINLSDEELDKLSLIKNDEFKKEEAIKINIKEIKNKEDPIKIDIKEIKNKDEEPIKNVKIENNDNDIFLCSYCHKQFSRKYNLKIHQIDRCKNKMNFDTENIKLQNNINNNYTYNTINNTTNNNIMLNIILNPYENKFDTSHIDNLTKMDLIINIIFTKALEHILENKNNLNLLLEDDHETAIIYKNDIEKFVRVKREDFTKNIMKNMKDALTEMNSDIEKNPYLTERIAEIIEMKYKKYEEEKKTNDLVNDMICKIYDQKKLEIQEVFKNANNNEDIIIF
jgi:hypothetical protein